MEKTVIALALIPIIGLIVTVIVCFLANELRALRALERSFAQSRHLAEPHDITRDVFAYGLRIMDIDDAWDRAQLEDAQREVEALVPDRLDETIDKLDIGHHA